jgi:hypothetical protein
MWAAANASLCFVGELPDELLLAIISQLRVERGYLIDKGAEEQRCCNNTVLVRSLHALTLSCRKFNALTTPLLYQCIIPVQRQLYMPVLLKTLFNKPVLAQHIQYIEFATFEYPAMNDIMPLTQSNINKYHESIVSTCWLVPAPATTSDILDIGKIVTSADQGLPTASDLVYSKLYSAMQCLWKFTYLSAFVVLLSIADNIQDIAMPDSVDALWILAFRKWNQPGVFRRLWLRGSSASLESHPLRTMFSGAKERSGHLSQYLRSFLLPESMCFEFGPPAAMKLLSLTIHDANCESLDEYLRGCASLECFSLRWQWTDKFLPRFAVDLPALHRSLQRVQKTLTCLTIDTSESAWRVDFDQVIPALGSLRGFKAITCLNVAGLVLWGDDDTSEPPPLSALLPGSLESLVIKTEWDDHVEDALHQLSIDCAVCLPRLKRVECNWRPAPGFVADFLIDAYQSAGVELVLDIEDA